MLSGYLYCDKEKFSSKSIIKLLFKTIFYCLIITTIFYAFNLYDIRTKNNLLMGLIPPTAGRYWYIVSYIFLFYMIPYLNIIIKKLGQKELKTLLIIIFIFFSLITTFGLRDYFKINMGYSPFWLIYCYFLGSYIKLYYNNKIKKEKILIYLCFSTLIVLLSKLIFNGELQNIFVTYVSPFIIINSVLIFILLKNINIKLKLIQKTIKFLSLTTFGVYIIHCHPYIYDFVIVNHFLKYMNLAFIYLFGQIIIKLVLLYLLLSIIDLIINELFKNKVIVKLLDNISSFIDKKLYY